jgi:hypothetical protein
MTRTDVMASSRPRTVGAAPNKRGSKALRGLLALPLVLLLALALMAPGTAFAATETTPTSGYNQEPNEPKTTPTTGTSPSKEEGTPTTTPEKETAPTSSSPAKEEAKTLPFTGFDLRWSFAIGLLLLAAGFSIVAMQRRHRRGES